MDQAIRILKSDAERQRRELVAHMECLGQKMLLTARRLDKDAASVVISPLGEVQGAGDMIDAMCGRYASTLEAIKLIEATRER